jgi:L-ascorbate metabolism protein UlaG (beta-lactamase superfamily)
MLTRRRLMTTAAAAGIVPVILPYAAHAAAHSGDMVPTATGEIAVHPVSHASFVMEVPGAVIYTDPVGGAAMYEGFPAPGLILVTHEHGDHYNAETLAALMADNTQIVTNPAVFDMLPEDLKARATALKNGDTFLAGAIEIVAIPAYNTTEDRKQYHPEGRDNGYVLTIDGARVYIAGDTEDIPEMRALTDIDIAFVPMNLPYTMDVTQAASAVNEFRPAYVYPYHYKGSDMAAFAAAVDGPEVRDGAWYDEA